MVLHSYRISRILKRIYAWFGSKLLTRTSCTTAVTIVILMAVMSVAIWATIMEGHKMARWFFIILAISTASLLFTKVWMDKGLRREKLIEYTLISVSLLTSLGGIIQQSYVEPSFRQPKPLKPWTSEPEAPPDEAERGGYTYDQGSVSFVVRGKNVVYQPLGLNVPLSMRRNAHGLMVSAVIRDVDGTEIAKFIDNEWKEFPKKQLRKNFDSHSIEVMDDDGIPIFQIDYINPFTVRLGGVFRTEFGKASELYDDFPSASGPPYAMSLGPGILFVVGGERLTACRIPQTDIDREKFRAEVKRFIKPLFDHSIPERLGVRKTPVTNVQPLHISLTNQEKNKYANLTNTQLKDVTVKFVAELREFATRVNRDETPADDDIRDMMNQLQKTSDANSVTETLSSVDISILRRNEEHQAEYSKRYRVTAIVLRGELLARLPKGHRNETPLLMYERPTNFFGYCIIADDLEKLANSLP